MTRALSPVAVVLIACLAGCAPTMPVAPPDMRVHLTSALRGIWSEPPIFTRETDGTLRVSVIVHNPTTSDVPILTHIDWYDISGRPLPTSLRGNRRLAIPREGEVAVDEISLNPAASNFRLFLDSDAPMGQPSPQP